MKTFFVIALLATTSACGRIPDPSSPSRVPNPPSAQQKTEKIRGPDVKALSYDELTSYSNECMKFGKRDDERVTYTEQYCVEVDAERNLKSLTRGSHAKAITGLPKPH